MEKVYNLLPHQAEAVTNINKNYKNHNVAGAVMPTGTGKSFIAMAQMIAINNDEYKGVDENGDIKIPLTEDGVVNNSKILYVAPTNEIAEQIKTDIVKYICKIDPNKINLQQRESIVKQAFPNLEFKCYKTLATGVDNHNKENNNGYNPYLDEPDLVILDEVHRSGAKTFQEGTAALLGCKVENDKVIKDNNAIESKKNIKVLSISATPERDVDSRDMTKVWAEAIGGYTEKELSDDERTDLGIKMTLPDAINKGILRNPNVVHFDCNLGETEEYKTLVRIANDEKLDISIREEASESIKRINTEVLGIEDYDKMSEEQKKIAREEGQVKVLIESINNGNFNIHGKFILFAPKDTNKNNPNKVSPFLEYHAKKNLKILEEALKKSDKNYKIEIKYISSSNSEEHNKEVLVEFDKKDVTTGPIYIVVAQEKFNEGVHAKNISGGFNTRSITEQENTSLRAQSILFLQQKGRFDASLIPGKEPPPLPTIFDMCNNFYTQNINGAIDETQIIPIFELTEKQKILHDSYKQIMSKVPEKSDITIMLPMLLQITNILNQYNIDVNCDNIKDRTTLLKLIEGEKDREELIKRFEEIGVIQKKANGKGYKDYNIGSKLKKARISFWKGTKAFGKYPLNQLITSGIIDKKSKEYTVNAINKKYVNEDGFIVRGVAKEFINQNIYTGGYFDEEGKDVEGFRCDQFDLETGLDEEGYNRRGFNEQGNHKKTKSIHDEKGFMEDGFNILTGTKFDLAGYNIDGIKPFSNKDGKIVGGFDREHHFHKFDEISETFCKVPSEKDLAPYDKNVNVDEYRFISGRKKNINRSELINGFLNNRINYFTNTEYNKVGYDIDGYDKNGFNIEGVNRETGTRFDKNGRKRSYYSSNSIEIREEVKKMKWTLYEKKDKKSGKVIYREKIEIEKNEIGENKIKIIKEDCIKNKSSKSYADCVKGFKADGFNIITGEYEDIYGFSFPQRIRSRGEINKYGFQANEVKDINMIYAVKEPNEKGSLYKTYDKYQYPINILGTDKSGHIMDNKGNPTNQLHPSLELTGKYIKDCIEGNMTKKEFEEKLAIKNKLLYNEAQYKLKTSINQAFTLYRICPELAKIKETKDIMEILYKAEPKKAEKLFEFIPNAKSILIKDKRSLMKTIQNINDYIEKHKQDEQKSIEKIKLQNQGLKEKLEELEKIQNLEEESR